MDFLHYKINAVTGQLVNVNKDDAANVYMLDPLNFSKYKRGIDWTGEGGFYPDRQVVFTVPYKGEWHIVLDLHGRPFSEVRATCQLS